MNYTKYTLERLLLGLKRSKPGKLFEKKFALSDFRQDPSLTSFSESTGSQAFLQSARIDLDKARGTAMKKTVGDSGGAASVLMGSWREALRLTLDTST